MSSERVTSAELERSKKARTIARNWLDAEETRLKLAGLDPALEGGVQMRPAKFGRPTALERVKEATVSGLEIKHFTEALGNGNVQQKSQGNASLKADLLRAVIASGRTPEQAEELMKRLSPYMLAVDDPAAALLVSRLGNGGEKLGFKEMLEIIQLTKNMQSPQSSSDASMANAIVNAIKVGSEISSRNSSNIDPATLLAQQTELVKTSYQNQLDLMKEQLKARSVDAELERLSKLRDLVEGTTEDPDIEKHRLSLADAQSQRAFELEKERWAKEWDSKIEDRRARNQSEMIKGIMGTASKIFESPIAKELGKNVGKRIGVAENPVEKIRSQAAQSQLATPQDPMSEQFGLECHKCKSHHVFTRRDLLSIESRGGKWVCDGTVGDQTCGEVFLLKNPEKKDMKDDTSGLVY